MSLEHNKATVQKFVDALNQHDTTLLGPKVAKAQISARSPAYPIAMPYSEIGGCRVLLGRQ